MQNIFQISAVHAGVITDATPISSILLNILDFLLSIIGILGIIGLVVSGVLYITAMGDEKRMRLAKRVSIGSAIGLVIALGAFVLIGQLAAFFS